MSSPSATEFSFASSRLVAVAVTSQSRRSQSEVVCCFGSVPFVWCLSAPDMHPSLLQTDSDRFHQGSARGSKRKREKVGWQLAVCLSMLTVVSLHACRTARRTRATRVLSSNKPSDANSVSLALFEVVCFRLLWLHGDRVLPPLLIVATRFVSCQCFAEAVGRLWLVVAPRPTALWLSLSPFPAEGGGHAETKKPSAKPKRKAASKVGVAVVAKLHD